ncbi:MAG: hypothetical protein ACP5IN_02210 [Caldimicrobium sp.]
MGIKKLKRMWGMGLPFALLGGALIVSGFNSHVEAKKAQPTPAEKADVQTCYSSQSEIKYLHANGKFKVIESCEPREN